MSPTQVFHQVPRRSATAHGSRHLCCCWRTPGPNWIELGRGQEGEPLPGNGNQPKQRTKRKKPIGLFCYVLLSPSPPKKRKKSPVFPGLRNAFRYQSSKRYGLEKKAKSWAKSINDAAPSSMDEFLRILHELSGHQLTGLTAEELRKDYQPPGVRK